MAIKPFLYLLSFDWLANLRVNFYNPDTFLGKTTSLRKKIVIQWVRKTVRNTKADERPSIETNIDDPTEMDEIMVMADVDQDGQWMVTWTVAKEKVFLEVMIIEIIDEQ